MTDDGKAGKNASDNAGAISQRDSPAGVPAAEKNDRTAERHTIANSNQTPTSPIRPTIGADRWIELGFTFAIMVATFVNVWVANRQWAVANGQLGVMQADQRPWVSLDMQIDSPLIRDASGLNFLVKYTMNNVGKSPAFDVDFLAKMIPIGEAQPNAPPPSFSFRFPEETVDVAVEEACKDLGALRNGQIMFPSVPQTRQWQLRSDLKSGFIPGFAVIGCATYKFYNDPVLHRTARIFELGIRNYGKMIDLGASTISVDDLAFFSHGHNGSRAN